MKNKILLLAFVAACSTAYAQEAHDSFGIFGVTVDMPSAVLTKSVVKAVTDGASSFGLQKQFHVSAVSGELLHSLFDAKQLTASERKAYEADQRTVCQDSKHGSSVVPCTSKVAPAYVLVTGVFGGGCVAEPTWTLPAPGKKSKLDGVTNMRCSKSSEEFRRLLHVIAAE